MPATANTTFEMTPTLQLSRNQHSCKFLPEKQSDVRLKPNPPLSEILAAINNSLMPQIELMRRDITNLYRENKKLIKTLTKFGIPYSSFDKLEAISTSPSAPTKPLVRRNAATKPNSEAMDTEMTITRMPTEESTMEKVPMHTNLDQPLKPSRYGVMHNERKSRIEENIASNNLLTNLTPADIVIKEKAFIEDFKLPLSPAEPLPANIYGLVGDDLIARGYKRVVTDGESIWLEIPEKWLSSKSFTKRQQTPSRQYFTLNGVTIHHQLQTELGRSPRRHKLAVKIPRAEPSSRLLAGKWYIHAHQVKIASCAQGDTKWLKLRTMRLVRILRKTFRANYNPRYPASGQSAQFQIRKNNTRKRSQNHDARRKNKPSSWEYIKLRQPVAPSIKSLANFPMPMQAPPQWLNPYNYANQIAPSNKNALPQKIQSKNQH